MSFPIRARSAAASRALWPNARSSFQFLAALLAVLATTRSIAGAYTLVGWSEQGVHETDGTDTSVFALALPGNTIRAQLMSGGLLVKATNGVVVTYQAIADASGSINRTSLGKGNFFQYVQGMLGAGVQPDEGLEGYSMPGATNTPQVMTFDPSTHVFSAVGIPITPYDDQGVKNRLPLMRLTARNSSGVVLATTDIALPITDEMDCRACHASGSQAAAMPADGWAWDCDSVRDFKLNILRYHDSARADWAVYRKSLMDAGYSSDGLVTTVQSGQAIACVRCHPSNATPGSGVSGMRPLTQLIHTKHAFVSDPSTGVPLTSMTNSAACYSCHAEAGALYERGLHRASVSGSGDLSMQCQGCHGVMTDVGTPGRQGWIDLPMCQSCHTGTETANNGAMYYTNAYSAPGVWRVPSDLTFATSTNLPAGTNGPPRPLFSAAFGHGGLQCGACHGSAHAELGTAADNDNVQSLKLQAHTGTLMDCTACHPSIPSNRSNGGPHGMHLAGASWAQGHGDSGGSGRVLCQTCHGADFRGRELSRLGGPRSMFGRTSGNTAYWQGFQVGCFTCHNGPSGDGGGPGLGSPAVVSAASTNTLGGAPIAIPVSAKTLKAVSLALRVVNQPAHGRAVIQGKSAVYFPAAGFFGTDSFSVTAWDDTIDSNLGNLQVTTTPGPCAVTAAAFVPAAAFPSTSVPFFSQTSLAGCSDPADVVWDFGDGTAPGFGTNACHTYAVEGDYTWAMTVSAGGVVQEVTGTITISPTLGPPITLSMTSLDYAVNLEWPIDNVPVSIETSYDLDDPHGWTPLTDPPTYTSTNATLLEFILPGQQFFRLLRVP